MLTLSVNAPHCHLSQRERQEQIQMPLSVEQTERAQKEVSAMEMQYFKDYSPALGREMECKV